LKIRSGCEKGETGNSIIGRNEFKSTMNCDSLTDVCKRENRRMNQKNISEGETLGNNLISLSADQPKAV